ncbi:MAG: efflux RND transporter periplasmic adaptor subunit [Bryobacterales bacterium]|nr:efflux RND transporter periplasmic adaptor subunit [Bryobacterales bacterium]
MKRILIQTCIALLLVLGLVYGGFKVYKQLPQDKDTLAVTTVRQGDFVVRAFTRGELRAVRSATLTAPNLFGQTQITFLAPLGAFAREGDLVAAYDDTAVVSRVVESEIELEKIQQQLVKAKADLQLSANKDEVDLLEARYNVRSAELQMKRNELISTIDARKNELNLEEAKRRLERLQSDVQSKREQAEAQIRVLGEQRRKALISLNRDKARVLEAKSLAPISGLMAVKQNFSAGGRFGAEVPDLREGDEIFPGSPVVDVLDLSELEIIAKVNEVDRANLREGQNVKIRLDALPKDVFNGTIKNLSATASSNVMSGDPAKKFDVLFSIDMHALLKAAGATPEEIRQIEETARHNREKAASRGGSNSGGGGRGGMGGFAGMAGAAGMMAGNAQAGNGGGFGGFGAGNGGAQAGMGGQSGAAEGGSERARSFRQQGAGGGQAGAQGGQSGNGSGGAQAGGGGRSGGFANMSAEDRQKMQAAMQKALNGRNIQDLSQEERQKIFAQLRGQMPGGGNGRGQADAASDAALEAGPTKNSYGFTVEQLKAATPPPPPGKGSSIDLLLRPGLLADVEILVDEIKDAITVPMQSVFDRDGKTIVFVKTPTGFEAREVTAAKRTENIMVIASGVKPGEVVALSDPFASKKPSGASEQKQSAPAGLPGGTR